MDSLDLQPLVVQYLFASTPSDLLRCFRDEESVQLFAAETSIAEILRSYNRVASRSYKTVGDVARCYAYVVALDLKGALYPHTEIKSYDLDWVDTLKTVSGTNATLASKSDLSI